MIPIPLKDPAAGERVTRLVSEAHDLACVLQGRSAFAYQVARAMHDDYVSLLRIERLCAQYDSLGRMTAILLRQQGLAASMSATARVLMGIES